MRTTDIFPILGKNKKRAISQRQLHKTTAITEGTAILLLIARIIIFAIYGKSAFTTILMLIVCAVTFISVTLILNCRIEKDDELSEMNKLKAYSSTLWIFIALAAISLSVLMFYTMIKGEPTLTIKLSVDGIVQIFLIGLSLFNFCNSFYFLRLDSDNSMEEE